jgi:hypothetical protein
MKYLKTYENNINKNIKKYIIVDFGETKNEADRYYILRIIDKKISNDDINYDKYYYMISDEILTGEMDGSYSLSKINIIYQTDDENDAIEKLKMCYTTNKYNL